MGVSWDDDNAILEDFARKKGGEASDFRILKTSYAGDDDLLAPENSIGACVKAGRTDGFAETLGGTMWNPHMIENKVYIGEGYRCKNATVKWIGEKL